MLLASTTQWLEAGEGLALSPPRNLTIRVRGAGEGILCTPPPPQGSCSHNAAAGLCPREASALQGLTAYAHS